jgi:hypothetical protein
MFDRREIVKNIITTLVDRLKAEDRRSLRMGLWPFCFTFSLQEYITTKREKVTQKQAQFEDFAIARARS